uniref:Uncharacterized protein n=1 Tax=Micrurus paraensis TaxID=1970185 RepID=A0A2D4KFE4_9SAUR
MELARHGFLLPCRSKEHIWKNLMAWLDFWKGSFQVKKGGSFVPRLKKKPSSKSWYLQLNLGSLSLLQQSNTQLRKHLVASEAQPKLSFLMFGCTLNPPAPKLATA